MNLEKKKTLNAKYFLCSEQGSYNETNEIINICSYSFIEAKRILLLNSGRNQIKEKATKIAVNLIMSRSNNQISKFFKNSRSFLSRRGKILVPSVMLGQISRKRIRDLLRIEINRMYTLYESVYS